MQVQAYTFLYKYGHIYTYVFTYICEMNMNHLFMQIYFKKMQIISTTNSQMAFPFSYLLHMYFSFGKRFFICLKFCAFAMTLFTTYIFRKHTHINAQIGVGISMLGLFWFKTKNRTH